MYYIQWHQCPSHNRLCPSYHWEAYAEMLRPIIQQVWEERQAMLLWLGLVEATHRDPHTMDYLERVIRLGTWTRRDAGTARRLAEEYGAELLGV